jgi:hypothetical protein
MMRFTSVLRASLVIVIIASIVCNSDAVAVQYVNSATIFGSCANFVIQAGTFVTFSGVQNTIHTGSVGVAPGTSITGTPLLSTGYTLQPHTAAAINCSADEATAYLYLAGVTCTHKLPNTDLSGLTLFQGVYCTGPGYFTLKTGALSLDAQGDGNAQFVFQTVSTLVTSANTNITLLNGALVKNIYWQIGSSVTLGASSSFFGQILAYVSITVGSTVTVVGRLFAQAAVTFATTDQITLPSQN